MPYTARSSYDKNQEIAHNIAILTFSLGGNHAEIMHGIRMANETSKQIFHIIPFYCAGRSLTSIRTNLARICEDKNTSYSVIVTIGDTVTECAQKYFAEHNIQIPIVFVGVSDPVERGYVTSLEKPDSYLTGVYQEPVNVQALASFVRAAKPTIHNAIIPLSFNVRLLEKQNPLLSRWEEFVLRPMTRAFHEHGIRISYSHGTSEKTVLEDTLTFLPLADTVMLLEGSTFLEMALTLGHECSKEGKTLFVMDRGAVAQNAALGYAASLLPIGEKACFLIQQIIFHGKQAGELSVQTVSDDRRPMLNISLAQQQKITVTTVKAAAGANLEIFEKE